MNHDTRNAFCLGSGLVGGRGVSTAAEVGQPDVTALTAVRYDDCGEAPPRYGATDGQAQAPWLIFKENQSHVSPFI